MRIWLVGMEFFHADGRTDKLDKATEFVLTRLNEEVRRS